MARLVQALLEFFKRLLGRSEELTALPLEPHPDEEVTDHGPSREPVEDEDTPLTVVPTEGNGEEPKMTRPNLARGSDNKEAVVELQTLLRKNGELLTVDGDFGGGTAKAVRRLRRSYGLEDTDVADADVWAILDRENFGTDMVYQGVPLPPDAKIPDNSSVAAAWNSYGNLLAMLAPALEITSAVACAVLAVESAGKGFWNGRMVIRFENHIFYRWGKNHRDVFDAHFQMDPNKSWLSHKWRPDDGAWRPLHTKAAGQDEEWAVLAFARTLDDTAALNSISMGAPQIMGFNSAKVGFDTVQGMFSAFSTDERAHVLGLFDFIRADHDMVHGLRTGDWREFAFIYNGSGQADDYGTKIGSKVDEAKGLGIP